MNAQAARLFLRTGFLLSPIVLVSCGGGDSTECFSPDRTRCTAPTPVINPSIGTLFTTAPAAVTLNAGSSVSYSIGGGTPPYAATSGNTNVSKASVSGSTFSLSSIAAGTTSIVVVDSLGKTVNIELTVVDTWGHNRRKLYNQCPIHFFRGHWTIYGIFK